MQRTDSLEKTLMFRKTEGRKRRGWQRMRWLDGITDSMASWTWIWANSGSWWWTGKPGMLQSMGSQRVGNDWVAEQQRCGWHLWCPSPYPFSSPDFRQLWWTLVMSAAGAAKSLQSCPTLRPHRWQPTRLHRPWDSPSKDTGVGCHFFLQCMKVKSESEKWKWSRSVVSDSSQPHGLQPTRLLHPWHFPGKSTGVGCHCLLR